MPVKPKEEHFSISQVAEQSNTRYGDRTMIIGSGPVKDSPRIPFGVFAVDFACVTGDSEIQDAETGIVRRVDDIVHGRMGLSVPSMRIGEDVSRGRHPFNYDCCKVVDWVEKGVRPCLRVRTRGGAETKIAEEHCFLVARKGWVFAKDLRVGDCLIRPSAYRWPFGDNKIDEDYLKFLGYWIAEGDGSGDHVPRIAATDDDIVQDLARIVESKGYSLSKDAISYSVVGAPKVRDWKGRYLETHVFRSMLKDLGLWGHTAGEKFIPNKIFKLRKEQLAILLSRMWMGDGAVARNRRSVTYTTISKRLANQVRFLLLRFGIYANIIEIPGGKRKFPNNRVYQCKKVFHVFAAGDVAIKRFQEEIPVFGKRAELLNKWVGGSPSVRVPFYQKNKFGCDSFLDPIVEIAEIGEREVFDVAVKPYHNLVIDGIVGHNTGGGTPVYGSTCLWGKNQGGKSTLTLNAAKVAGALCWKCFNLSKFCACSKRPLFMKTVFLDVEGSTLSAEGRIWADSIGVNPDMCARVTAEYGEQFMDIGLRCLKADDCGLLVVDSLASLVPETEMEASLSDQFIGKQAALITKVTRKIRQYLLNESKRDHPCAVIFTNQLRYKIGGYGDPETQSGGEGMQHMFDLLLRCAKRSMSKDKDAKYIEEARGNKEQAVRHVFSIKKEKVFTLCGDGEYVRIKEDIPELELKKGMVDDFTTVLNYAKEYGIIIQEKGGWKYFNYKAKTLDDVKKVWRASWEEYVRVQMEIIKRAKKRVQGE